MNSSRRKFLISGLGVAMAVAGCTSDRARTPSQTRRRLLKFGDQGDDVLQLQDYLTRFGYFPNPSLSVYANWRPIVPATPQRGVYDRHTVNAIRSFQIMHGLVETGDFDQATISLMEAPRCGVPDIIPRKDIRWVAYGTKWSKSTLRYHIDDLGPLGDQLSGNSVQVALREACKSWSSVAPLAFIESEGAEIRIKGAVRNHGDNFPFDGKFNVTAHAYYPPPCGGELAGDIHFDGDETWGVNGEGDRLDLQSVALHELGHAIGLSHSSNPEAVMYSVLNYGIRKRELNLDDMNGLKAIYFPKKVFIRNVSSGWALDGGGANLPHVYMNREANASYKFQTWELRPTEQDGQYLVVAADNRALDGGGKKGIVYTHDSPDPAIAFRRWTIKQAGSNPDVFMLINASNGAALDGGGVPNVVYVNPKVDQGNKFQLWRFD